MVKERFKKFGKTALRISIWLIVIFLILLGIIYCLLSSSSFLTKVVLPEFNKRNNIKITAEELDLKIFSGIQAKNILAQFPDGMELTASQIGLDFIFKKLFEDTFYLNDLTITGLKFNDQKIGSVQADVHVSGAYLFADGGVKADLTAELNSLRLADHPTLTINQPTKLTLNLNYDPSELKSAEIKSKISALDFSDSEIGSGKAELELNGSYSLSDGSSKGNLKSGITSLTLSQYPNLQIESGTKLSSDFKFNKNKLQLKKVTASIQPKELDALELAGNADINLAKNDYDLKFDLTSKTIPLEKILALFDSPDSPKATKTKKESTKKKGPDLKLALNYQIKTDKFTYGTQTLQQAQAKGVFLIPKSQQPDVAALPGNLSYQAQITAQELETNGLKLTTVDARGVGTNEALKIQQLKFLQGEKARADTNGTINFNSKKFTLNLDLKELQLESVLPSLCGEKCQAIKGLLPSAKLALQGEGFSGEQFNKNLTGTLSMTGDNVFLPAKFQDIPPINIVFLPYVIASKISSLTIARLLPDSFLNVSSKADDALSEKGRLKIKDFDLQVVINEEAYNLQKADFRLNLVPSADFSGTIYKNGKLSMEVGLWLIGIQLRVPVGGKLSLPLPKLYKLPVTLAKGLGLSVLDLIPGTGSDSSEKSDE